MPSRMEDLVKMLITGQASDPAPLPEGEGKGIKTLPFVEAGQKIVHEGPLHITGPVGAGATVTVKKGGLLVDGDIGDGAVIDAEDDRGGITISGDNVTIRNISIGGSSRVTINGRDVTAELKAKKEAHGPEGLTVKGTVGTGVTLSSSTDLRLEQLAAAKLTARVGRDLIARNIGKGAQLDAGRDIDLSVLFAESTAHAGRDATIQKAAESCILSTGRDVKIENIVAGTQVFAGRDVFIRRADSTGPVTAGRDLDIRLCHAELRPVVGRRAAIKQRFPS